MPSFSCVCGAVIREEDEPRDASCALVSLHSLATFEHEASVRIAAFVATPEAQRPAWVRENLGETHSGEAQEVIEDLVYESLNERALRPAFHCPACGRLALAEGGEWSFFAKEQTGGTGEA